MSATVIHAPSEEVDQWDLLRVQLGGAVAAALLSMLAVVVTPTSIELAAARFTAATTIGALVFLESRTSNTALRAAVYSLTGACIGPATGAESTVIRVLGGLCC